MLHLVLADFRAAGTEHFPAGALLNDVDTDVTGLQGAGLASVPFEGSIMATVLGVRTS